MTGNPLTVSKDQFDAAMAKLLGTPSSVKDGIKSTRVPKTTRPRVLLGFVRFGSGGGKFCIPDARAYYEIENHEREEIGIIPIIEAETEFIQVPAKVFHADLMKTPYQPTLEE